jgi:hypothetical protein
MAQQDEPKRPVLDTGLAPREVPFYRGQGYQGDLSTRKSTLLDGGPGLGYIPGHGGTRRGSSLHAGSVHEATLPVANKVSFGKPMPAAGQMRRPMPREVEVYRTPAPGGGSFVRHLDGHTTHERDRPALVEYHNSLDPEGDADERAGVAAEISNRDALHNHKYW